MNDEEFLRYCQSELSAILEVGGRYVSPRPWKHEIEYGDGLVCSWGKSLIYNDDGTEPAGFSRTHDCELTVFAVNNIERLLKIALERDS